MTTIRTLIWFALAALAMVGAVWLAERPGTVTAEWQGWRLDSSVGALLIGIVILMLLGVGAWMLYRWIVGAPVALLEGWGESRKKRGYRELTQGLAAVAAGDGAEAQRHARRAEQLLGEPPMTLLLSAQAAQLAGDRDGAQRAYTAMLEDDQMAFIGLRGLIAQALREGDQTTALGYAERAFRLRPQTPWVVHTLFDMQAQLGQWRTAQETLDTGVRRKAVTVDKGRNLRALLLLERSREAERDGHPADALELAREAFRLAPDRIPVTRRLAELQLGAGDAKRAIKTLERGWTAAPHPDLAQLYLRASGETDPMKRIAVARRLAGLKPNDIESQLVLAQASLDAGLWGEARRQLETAGGSQPAVRVCRMMADLEERAASEPARVHDWLARAAAAPADCAWRCTACNTQHEAWRAVCASCGAFGTLQWRAPGSAAQLLPPETRAELEFAGTPGTPAQVPLPR
ncbi:heme biosynthesis protein HemY [Reyranella sp.]|uniref:heme biosynthesis protein HemY n=1 Tax=Reyranella sp. TaxID=1929291 RepID=UPI003BA8E7B1